MRKTTLLSAILTVTVMPSDVTHASISAKPLTITTVLTSTNQDKPVKSTKSTLFSKKENNRQTLTDNTEGLLIIGKQMSRDSESVSLEYILIDMNKKPNAVIFMGTKQIRLNGNANLTTVPPYSVSISAK